MTYITSFRCSDGIVFGADTLEVFNDQRVYAEKLERWQCSWGWFVVGVAGNGDLADAFIQCLKDGLEQFVPDEKNTVENRIKGILSLFYDDDVTLELPKNRSVKFLIGASHLGELHLWASKGKRLLRVKDYQAIGYDAPIYRHFAKRLYNPQMPISQGVILAVFLLNLAKDTTTSVGGDRLNIPIPKSKMKDNKYWALVLGKKNESIIVFLSYVVSFSKVKVGAVII